MNPTYRLASPVGRVKFKRLLLQGLSASALFLSSLGMGAAAIQPVSHVLHISVDGLGGLYLGAYLSNSPAEFPNFARLAAEGASTCNARCDAYNSVTMPNHLCMLTGRPVLQPEGWDNTTWHGYDYDGDNYSTIHDSGNPDVPYKASTFDVAHDHGLSTAFFGSKAKFVFFTRSYDADHGAPDLIGDHGTAKMDYAKVSNSETNPPTWYASEDLTVTLTNQMALAPWNYVFIHFSEPDYNGHFTLEGWGGPAYSNAVRHVDLQLGWLLAAIQANPALSNHTALVLSADHGGWGRGHGNPFDPFEFHLPFFVWGPGVPPGSDPHGLMANRADPGDQWLTYSDPVVQPLRNGDTGNLALALLGLPPIPGSSLRPQLRDLRYSLTLTRTPEGLKVSWPSGAERSQLEAAESLTGDWTPITDGIAVENALNVLTIPAGSAPPTLFFRLRES